MLIRVFFTLIPASFLLDKHVRVSVVLALGNHATVNLQFLLKVHVLFAHGEKLLVAAQELLSQLDYFVASACNLVFHVRDEQVLVKLVDV